jgi:hypothetical protein
MSEAVHFCWDKRRTRRSAALLLAIGACGLLIVLSDGLDAKILGVTWATAFAILAAAVYSRGYSDAPVVSVSEAGLHDRRISKLPIAWSSIAHVGGFDAENVPFIGVDFHDPGEALGGAKPLVRLIAPIHRRLRFPAVSINTSLLDGSDEDLIAAIQRFRPGLSQQD